MKLQLAQFILNDQSYSTKISFSFDIHLLLQTQLMLKDSINFPALNFFTSARCISLTNGNLNTEIFNDSPDFTEPSSLNKLTNVQPISSNFI